MRTPRIPWSQEEEDYLQELIGDYPTELLCTHYRRWASRAGHPSRTDRAIKDHVNKLGQTLLTSGIYVRVADLEAQLNRRRQSIFTWIKRGLIPSRYITRARQGTCIRREGIRYLARRHPEKFSSVNRLDLFLLLEDEELADAVHEHNIGRRHYRYPVICLTTGRRFPSVADAAKANSINVTWLRTRLREAPEITCGNLRWKLA